LEYYRPGIVFDLLGLKVIDIISPAIFQNIPKVEQPK